MAKRNTYFEDEKIEKKIDLKQLRRTLTYILPYKRLLILVSSMMLVAAVVSLLPPRLLKLVVDEVVVNQDYRRLALTVGSLALLAAVEILSSFVQARSMGKMGLSIITRIRADIFERLQQLSFDYFDNRPDGKIVVRVTEYINGLADFFSNYVMMFAIYVVKLVVVTVFMLSLSPMLTLIVFASVVPMMVIIFRLRSRLRKMYAAHRAKNSNRTAFLVESIMGEQIVKNYNRIEINRDIYRQIHEESVNMWWDIVKRSRLNGPVVQLFWNAGTLCIFGAALALILGGDVGITAGVVITFTSYMGAFQDPLAQLSTIIQELAQVSSNLEQVFDTIDYPAEIQDKENCVVLKNVRGKVDFQDVTFCYEENTDILRHFTLHVKPGETIALVGPTGAGKTTIISMLTRFYDVRQGSVSIDDVDVRDVSLYSLRSEVGVLMQEPFIFKGTVMDNIRYGKLDATDDEVIAAAKTVCAHDFISQMENGYYTEVNERGSRLSAGQRQLISFARALLADPKILILDEATSSIDTETEILLQKGLNELLKGRTSFIIAHRLSTIQNADCIMYIDKGGILERGTHEELVAQKGAYYDLYMSQYDFLTQEAAVGQSQMPLKFETAQYTGA